MKFGLLTLLILTVSCSTGPSLRYPAQERETLNPEERLKQWAPVKESSENGLDEDHQLGLFVNSERPVALELIKEAQNSIDIEIYEMKDITFRRLLIEALERKVTVRIVKDSNTVGDSCNELEPIADDDEDDCKAEKEYISELMKKGAQYVWFNKKELCGIPGRSCFQHGKMIIADNKYLLLSTGNFNSSSFCNKEAKLDKCNRDFSYVTKNREVIDGLRGVLELDQIGVKWDMLQVISDMHLGLTVSPKSADRLVSLIKSAKQSIWIQNQYLEDPAINAALIERAKDGVEVNVQVAAFCNFGDISENKKNKINDIYTDFDKAGIKSKVFHSGMEINEKPGYLHAKAIVVDASVGWIGSINGSETSSLQNREFGIIFEREKSVDKLLQTLKEDFNHPAAMQWKDAMECAKSFKPRQAP